MMKTLEYYVEERSSGLGGSRPLGQDCQPQSAQYVLNLQQSEARWHV